MKQPIEFAFAHWDFEQLQHEAINRPCPWATEPPAPPSPPPPPQAPRPSKTKYVRKPRPHKLPREVPCRRCGDAFLKTARRHYYCPGCAKEVRAGWQRKQRSKKRSNTEINRVCPCGKTFVHEKAQRYCSAACRNQGKYARRRAATHQRTEVNLTSMLGAEG